MNLNARSFAKAIAFLLLLLALFQFFVLLGNIATDFITVLKGEKLGTDIVIEEQKKDGKTSLSIEQVKIGSVDYFSVLPLMGILALFTMLLNLGIKGMEGLRIGGVTLGGIVKTRSIGSSLFALIVLVIAYVIATCIILMLLLVFPLSVGGFLYLGTFLIGLLSEIINSYTHILDKKVTSIVFIVAFMSCMVSKVFSVRRKFGAFLVKNILKSKELSSWDKGMIATAFLIYFITISLLIVHAYMAAEGAFEVDLLNLNVVLVISLVVGYLLGVKLSDMVVEGFKPKRKTRKIKRV